MKGIISIALLLALLLPVAAQRPQVGFIRLVNLVAAGEGNTKFGINGQDLHAKGYRLGQKTGGMGFKADRYTISVKKEGCRAAEREVEITAGETQTLIAFPRTVAADHVAEAVR